MDQKLQLVIDGYNNQVENAIKTRIPWRSPTSPILFLIYISGAFKQVKKEFSEIVSLLFMDDLGFIVLETSL